MKKFWTILFLMLFCNLQAVAEYQPIPANLRMQYKKEIEQMIRDAYPEVKNNADSAVKDAKILFNNIMKNDYEEMEIFNIQLISEVVIPASSLDLFARLMQVTQEKYLGIKYEPIGTDSTIAFEKFMQPYFEDNNIDMTDLYKIFDYENKQNKKIQRFLKIIEIRESLNITKNKWKLIIKNFVKYMLIKIEYLLLF